MRKKITSFQSMRFFGSFLVFQYHLWGNYLNVHFESPGTDTFLVMAGFLTALVDRRYIATGEWSRYIKGRYLRLYVTFTPVFLIYLFFGRDTLTVDFVLKSFFLIPIRDQLPLVGPAWMLTLFLLFYWIFSLSILLRREWVLIPIFGIWGGACLYLMAHNVPQPLYPEWFDTLFYPRNLELILGYLAGRLFFTHRASFRLSAWTLGAGIVTLIGGAIYLNLIETELVGLNRPLFYGLPLTFTVIGLAWMEQNDAMHAAFTDSILTQLGDTTYVMYLTHNIITRVWNTVIPITRIQTPIISLVVVAAAYVGYHVWEKPVLNYLRKKIFSAV